MDDDANNTPRALRERFSSQNVKYILNGVILGYQMAEQLIDDTPWLGQTRRGRAKLSHLRNVAIESVLLEMAKLGEISFSGEEIFNRRRTHSFARFQSPNCIMTINYVHNPAQFPRRAFFRNKFTANNIQGVLFPEMFNNNQNDLLYTVLTHGGDKDKLLFATIGAPLPGRNKWGMRLPIYRWAKINRVEQDNKLAQSIAAKKPRLKKEIIERLNTNEGEDK